MLNEPRRDVFQIRRDSAETGDELQQRERAVPEQPVLRLSAKVRDSLVDERQLVQEEREDGQELLLELVDLVDAEVLEV